ncbi:AMP-binding protein [Burkholderia ubonensis]|uniref:Carrier domain-containing protein n=1 Tax=Burkholderia ubonensis TaxID=101571 RepID=A0ABD4E5Z9_9BURK|nr:AMP-binding protein [Burkholderia ubonensis]KVN88984.1 hypothetical protein WJ68_05645 [Burkholderia ubonensis]
MDFRIHFPDYCQTLPEIIRHHAQNRPKHTALRFLSRKGHPVQSWSYAELAHRMDHLAGRVGATVPPGGRVLVLGGNSQLFALAVLATMAAGCVAVPVAQPSSRATRAHVERVLADCAASALVYAGRDIDPSSRHAEEPTPLAALPWLSAAELPAEDGAADTPWLPPPLPAAVAFLQYTSGSTRNPRGVVVTHAQLLQYLKSTGQVLNEPDEQHYVGWLPLFHDMGLIGQTFQPLYKGQTVTLMPPTAFLAQPSTWMRALSDFGATHTLAPNFAYELCAKLGPPEDIALDLSSLRCAIVGAEPVRAATLERFASVFSPFGLDRAALCPAYGLAEATLAVSVTATGSGWSTAFSPGNAKRRVVACGNPLRTLTVEIVDPDTRQRCPQGAEGEIWVSGASVAERYWQTPDPSYRPFGATLADGSGPFLRTGDLGFVSNANIFVTGRLDDMMIVRGRNLHSHDIEATITGAHPCLGPVGAVFADPDADGEDRVIAVHEVVPGTTEDECGAAIRSIGDIVLAEYGIALGDLSLVARGVVPRTTSGKVRRAACRQLWQDGALKSQDSRTRQPNPSGARKHAAVEGTLAWLRHFASNRLRSDLMDERRSLAPHVVLSFGARGLFGLQSAPAEGGLGLSFPDLLPVFSQLGAIDLSLATLVGIHNFLGLSTVAAHARPDVAGALVPLLSRGQQLVSFAYSEPEAGADMRAIRSTARPLPDGRWRLDGRKMWIGSAAWADHLIVFAHDVRGALTAFLVSADAPGVRIGPEALTMGLRATVQNEIVLDNVVVGPEAVLGVAGNGDAIARQAMTGGRVVLCAAAVGAMHRCAQLMGRYAGRRIVAHRPLIDQPLIRIWIADTLDAARAIERLAAAIALAVENREQVPEEVVAAAKVAASELLWQSADRCMQVLGARGYVESNPVARLLRDARVLRIYEGPTEALMAFIGARTASAPSLVDDWLGRFASPGVDRAELSAALRTITTVLADAPPEIARHAAGDLVVAALTAAAAPQDVRRWAHCHWEDAAVRWRSAARRFDGCPASTEILAVLDDLTRSIGDITMASGGEERQLDPYLQPHPVPGAPDHSPFADERDDAAPPLPLQPPGDTARVIERLLLSWLARESGRPDQPGDDARSFAEWGMDSLKGLALTAHLREQLGHEVPLAILWQARSIAHAAQLIAAIADARPNAGAEDEKSTDAWETVRI